MNDLSCDWKESGSKCPGPLRLYAEKYHGHEKPAKHYIPQSVLDIFTEKQAVV
jgi:hypothetical protein